MARARTAACAALIAALAACAGSTPPARVAPGHEGAPGVERFLLAPANLAIALRPELESGVEPVQQEIVDYLALHGRRIDRLSLPEGRPAWEQAAEAAEASGAPGFETAAAAFVRQLAATRDFDAVVMPSLLLHFTSIRHRTAEWDGVSRRMALVNVPHRTSGRGSNSFVDGVGGGGLKGDTAVSSLHIAVVARDGQIVFEGRGGLELLHDLDLADVEDTYRVHMRQRGDLFQDRVVLREGVEVAFRPYLVPPAAP